jgi:alpha,alpha-trehalase
MTTWIENYSDCLDYIDSYWNKIIYRPSRMRLRYRVPGLPFTSKGKVTKQDISPNFIKLPHYYFVPNDNKFTYVFYWDSFFMFRGLLGTKHEWIMKEMVENFMYLFKTFDIIPNFSAPASMGRSQPPFLSSMVMDTYLKRLNPTNPYKHAIGVQKRVYTLAQRKWLKQAINVAKKEYELVWIDKSHAYNHSVKGYGLSRYGDRDIGYAHSSELESGWDMTSRFYNRCDQFLPIDLNSYLYKYETDFALAAQILGNLEESSEWTKKANARKREINKYMWNDSLGLFVDYGYTYKQPSAFLSLASFTPLWAGYATPEQARRTVEKLSKFETPYGLTITAKDSLAKPIDLSTIQKRYHPAIEEIIKPKQWDYPCIFSPLEYLAVIGLLRYGYVEEAKRIMSNSVQTHAKLFRQYGTFFEKLNGEKGEPSIGFHYEMQQGFGWTNAAFYRYIQILTALDTMPSIYVDHEDSQAPFSLAILH